MSLTPTGTAPGARGPELTSEFIALTNWATLGSPCSSSFTPTWTAPRLLRRRGQTASRWIHSALTLFGIPQSFLLPLGPLLRLHGVRDLRHIRLPLGMLLTIFLVCYSRPTSLSPHRRLTTPLSISQFMFTAASGYSALLVPYPLTSFFRHR